MAEQKTLHSVPVLAYGLTVRRGWRWWRKVLLIALVGVAVVVAWGSWRMRDATWRERLQAVMIDWNAIETALTAFHYDVGRFPTAVEGLGALIQNPGNLSRWRGPYLSRRPLDPWGNVYDYQPPDSATGLRVRSAGPDGVVGTGDDLEWLWPQKTIQLLD